MSKQALHDAFVAGWSARMDEGASRYGAERAFSDWWTRAVDTVDRSPLTSDEQRQQGMSCSCRGTDDYCPCQNVRLSLQDIKDAPIDRVIDWTRALREGDE